MKKVSAIIVCCLLAVALIALPVLAAPSATFTVSANKTTVDPGDTITVTVSTTKLENCSETGIGILFDTAFLEYVSGECKTTGGVMAGVNPLTGKASCFFKAMSGMTIEGTIYELKFKVKDSAVGSTQITYEKAQAGTGYEVTANTLTIKVNCDHQWGQWTPDGANHKRVCTKGCGEFETQGHQFGSWTTTTPAGCDTAGEKTRTCTVCNQPETASIAATGNHTFTGAWTKVDDNTHERTCTTCQDGTPAVETKAHTWGTATVTTPAGCDTAGEKTQTCTDGCGATKKTPIAATGNHVYGAWVKVDGTNHKRTCTTCQDGTPAVETKAHTWGSWTETLKPDCKNPGEKTRTCTDNCGATETAAIPSTGEHNYNTWTMVDDKKHTATCSGCGEFPVTEDHTWDNGTVKTPAGCDKAGVMLYTCTANGCGAEKEEPIAATGNHVYGAWEKVDEINHKRTCTTCQDGTPEVETEAHKAGTELKSDAENHWYECVCGEKMNVTAHTYDKLIGDAEGHTQGCECGALKDGAVKVPHNWDEGVVTKKPTSKAEGEKTFTCNDCGFKRVEKIDKVSTPTTGDNTLVIPMVILAVLSACGLAVTVVARKRASR